MKTRPNLLLPALLLAAAAHAGDGSPPQGLKTMPAKQIDALNRSLSPTSSEDYYTPPKVLEAYVPIYPASRLLSGKTGNCRVSFTIGTDGKASGAKPDPDADVKMCDHALYALRHWQFAPAEKDGQPVSARFRLPFNYSIR